MELNGIFLTLERLNVYFQLLISEINKENQVKINEILNRYEIVSEEFISDDSFTREFHILKCTHPQHLGKSFTPIQALSRTLLDLRSNSSSFEDESLNLYLTFKLAIQSGMMIEWQKIKDFDDEKDYFTYITAESEFKIENYQDTINRTETLIQKYTSIQELTLDQKMFFFDCYNLLISARILNKQYEKTVFDFNQYEYYFRKYNDDVPELISKVWYWTGKHKLMMTHFLRNEKTKLNSLIREFRYDKKYIKDNFILGLFSGMLGLISLSSSDFITAENHFLESMHFFDQFGSPTHVNTVQNQLVSLYIQQGNLLGAVRMYEKQSQLKLAENQPTIKLDFKILLSQCYLILGQIDKSKVYFDLIEATTIEDLNIKDPILLKILLKLGLIHNQVEIVNMCQESLKIVLNSIEHLPMYKMIMETRVKALLNSTVGNYTSTIEILFETRNKAIEQQEFDYLFEINLDIVIVLLKQYRSTHLEYLRNEIHNSLEDIRIYINSLENIEPKVILLKGLAYYYFSINQLDEGLICLKEGFDILDKEDNLFLVGFRSNLAKLSTYVQQNRGNTLMILISELNQYDIASSTIVTSDLFVPKSITVTETIWRDHCLQEAISCLQTIELQQIEFLRKMRLNLNHLPGIAYA